MTEKALLDSFYLASLGRYSLDVSALDLTRVNESTLADLSTTLFPPKTRKYLERHYAKVRKVSIPQEEVYLQGFVGAAWAPLAME